jgi:hypothetical protein
MLCEKGEPGEGTDAAAGEAGFIGRSKRAHLANTLTAISSSRSKRPGQESERDGLLLHYPRVYGSDVWEKSGITSTAREEEDKG